MPLFEDITAQILKIDEGLNRSQAANNRIGTALQTIQNNPGGEGLTRQQAEQVLAAVTIEGDAALNIATQIEANATLAEQIAGTIPLTRR